MQICPRQPLLRDAPRAEPPRLSLSRCHKILRRRPHKTRDQPLLIEKTTTTSFIDHHHKEHTTPTDRTITMTSRTRTRNARPMSAAAAADLAQQRADQKRESKKRKEQFLIFIKALMRDLAQMDPAMHARAKAIIQDCTDKKKRRVPGFDFETNMRTRLLETVGESNWRRVERNLHRCNVARKEENKQHRLCSTDVSLSSNSSTASLSLTSEEPEPEARQEMTECAPSVTLSLNDLSLNDGSVEVEVTESERDKKERLEAEAKVDAFVQKIQSRPPAAVVVPEEPRYIYI